MGSQSGIRNALSIDVEDWFCVSNIKGCISFEDWDNQELRVVGNTRRILDLLSKHDVKATFFVLGWIAEQVPDLIKEIGQRGHEVATHGYSHSMITEMTPETFEEDLKKAIEITRRCTDSEIVGFRAPSFTVTPETRWALDVLVKNGIRYDSSIFPVSGHPDYGMPDSPLGIHEVIPGLMEAPLSVSEFLGKRVPCSGGGYFRLLPYSMTRYLMRKCNSKGRPVIFYLHPWEIDPEQPRVDLPLFKRFRHYNNLNKTFGRLDRLLGDFEFTTIRKVIGI